jgi:polysaccharide pyruvyl transferase WcaK-like protein
MKIVLFTATGAENLGDELITLCEIQNFQSNIPGINITLFSHDIERTRRFLLSQKCPVENFSIKEYFPNGLRKSPLKNFKLFWETIKVIKGSDHVYVGGGGLLY